MPDARWKQAERRLAALFGTVRRALSGGNSKTGRSDAMHAKLFLECKSGKYVPLFTLYRATRILAQRERRVPVIGLCEKGKPGVLLVFNSNDFLAVCTEWARANGYKLLKVNNGNTP